jgi:hypothetical protein
LTRGRTPLPRPGGRHSLRVALAQLDNARVRLEVARVDYPARRAAAEAQLAAARAASAKSDADWRRQSQLPPIKEDFFDVSKL